ncbi:medium-chain fatty acid-CoA ligase faa2 [Mucor velutinosus]|uniref:Medium-chain fatty acid-CoA ligase faa2 n=1 Tax=Mucor velutinosus TaxID=708070 RepID=A0AAN7DBP8_9FUNG|nr:medium-chain fatty acid-CoA ligase faa2 [Mucor velutinosus]
MQVSPLLTPTNFISNIKKRPRAIIDDDFESHYFKKRLISTIPNLKPPSPTSTTNKCCNRTPRSPNFNDSLGGNVTLSPTLEEEESTTSNHRASIDDTSPYPNQIHLMDINGTLLPMEQKPGETKYSIPGFVLSDTTNKPLQPPSGQLILYEKNPVLASIEKEQQLHQQSDDNDSLTSEENDNDYDPMDLD